jgi:protocatechuate 3,4-dioxygenase beta subunit
MLMLSEPQGRQRPLTAKSNPEGEYELKEVKPGRYHLRANRNGYVSQAYGQKSPDSGMSQGTLLMVRAGETLGQVDFKLIRGGVIEGRIVDPDGEPVAQAQVMVERYMTHEGKRNLRPMGGGSTDDRGQFRLFDIAPGKYFVSARFRNWASEDQDDSTYPPVYYPGTPRAQEAARIEVTPGGEIQGIDITLTESKAFSISGKVFRADGKPATEAFLVSMRAEEEDFFGWTFSDSRVDAEGNFKLGGLLPGRYRLTAESRRSEKPQMASVNVDLGNEDVAGVVLALGDGGEISGKVIVEGADPKSIPASMRLFLQPEGGRMMFSQMEGGEVLEDQTFSFRNVMEGAYRLAMLFTPTNLYLKSARVQGKEVLEHAFEIRNGEKITGAEVVLSANGGELSGVVKQEETGEVVKGATIVLFSADPERQGPRSRWTRTTQSDQQGSFQLGGLAPGSYLVCALVNHESGAESSPDYLQELAKLAKSVEIHPQSKISESLLAHPAPVVE